MKSKQAPIEGIFLALFALTSCGVEVGNPTKPAPAPSAADQDRLALVAAEQLEETVTAASENQANEGGASSLALLPDRSCMVNADASVSYTLERNDAGTFDLPRINPTRRIAQTSSRSVAATLKSDSQGLGCRIGGRLPSFNWQLLTGFQAEISASRTVDRSISDLSTMAVAETVHVNASGSRQLVWERQSLSGTAVALQKTLHFDTKLSRNAVNETYDTTIETLENLVIRQTLQASAVQSFVIVSGAVLSDYKEGQKIKISYSNLEFIKGPSCYPDAGSVAASIHMPEDLNTALLSFKITFHQGEAALLFEDGSVKELLLADCNIKN